MEIFFEKNILAILCNMTFRLLLIIRPELENILWAWTQKHPVAIITLLHCFLKLNKINTNLPNTFLMFFWRKAMAYH